MEWNPSAAILPTLLAFHGFRKGSLSASGAIAAFTVGYVSLANRVQAFGATLLLFYLVGSRATKVGHLIKERLETEHPQQQQGGRDAVSSSSKESKSAGGGRRDAWQVLCNSATGASSAILFNALYGDQGKWNQGSAWCLFEDAPRNVSSGLPNGLSALEPFVTQHTPRLLFLIMLGHFACCMGDTLASELGILAKSPPRLILPPFRVVPPGTNGGLSLQGTLGSLFGGTFIGIVAGAFATLYDNPACRANAATIISKTVLLGAAGGLLGSGLDSILGATLQRTWYNRDRKQILLGRLPADAANEKGGSWEVVTGYDVLGNNAVNIVSSFVTALSIAYIGNVLFSS